MAPAPQASAPPPVHLPLLTLGLVLGAGTALSARLLGLAGPDGLRAGGLLGVLLTASTWGLAGLLGAPALYISRRLGSGPVGRAVALAPLLVAILWHAAATVIHLEVGAWPSRNSLAIFLHDPSQVLFAALHGYGAALAVTVVAMLVITAASERAVHWMEARPCPRREHGVPVLLLALPGLLFLRLPPESAWWRQLHGSTAEASMWREDGLVVDDALASIVPDSGPPFEAATRWLAEAKQRTDRPNVLFLVIESLSRGHVGAYGYPRPVTPNIDAIAADGLAWEEIRSTSSLSSYAQLAILSSLDPRRGPHLQTYTNLDYPRVLLHDALVPLGWRAGVISSQNEDWGGMRRFLQTGTPLDFWDVHDHPGPYMGEGGDKKVPDRFTIDEAITWTAREPGRPWALYVNLQRTHYPYHPPETPGPFQPADPGPGFAFLSWPSSQREAVVNRYDNALLDLDTQIGRLVGELQRRGDWDRTLVVLTSDHGELLEGGERVGHGKFLDEEELRVPLILRLRGRLAVGRSAVPGSHLDVLPTVARLLGLPPHPAWQGTSLLDPERPRSRPIFATLQGLKNVDVVLCWPRKLVADWNGGHAALHDLRVDPGERQDLAAAQPEVTDALSLLLARHITSQVRYHEPRDSTRQRQFAPRLLDCPAEP